MPNKQNQCSAINKQCSVDLGVAYDIYLDISNILKPNRWYTIALLI